VHLPSEGVIAIRLLLAAAVGGVVGLERELSGHRAGLRTHISVALGSIATGLVTTAILLGSLVLLRFPRRWIRTHLAHSRDMVLVRIREGPTPDRSSRPSTVSMVWRCGT
jgi:hypothetical protein